MLCWEAMAFSSLFAREWSATMRCPNSLTPGSAPFFIASWPNWTSVRPPWAALAANFALSLLDEQPSASSDATSPRDHKRLVTCLVFMMLPFLCSETYRQTTLALHPSATAPSSPLLPHYRRRG